MSLFSTENWLATRWCVTSWLETGIWHSWVSKHKHVAFHMRKTCMKIKLFSLWQFSYKTYPILVFTKNNLFLPVFLFRYCFIPLLLYFLSFDHIRESVLVLEFSCVRIWKDIGFSYIYKFYTLCYCNGKKENNKGCIHCCHFLDT